jgi:hypothetical protein
VPGSAGTFGACTDLQTCGTVCRLQKNGLRVFVEAQVQEEEFSHLDAWSSKLGAHLHVCSPPASPTKAGANLLWGIKVN